MIIKIIDVKTAKLKEIEILENIEHGIDVVSDENITIKTRNQVELNTNDLVLIQEDYKEYYYVINSIENTTTFNCSSFLDIFNQELYLENKISTLYDFLYKNFVNNTVDPARNILWLDISNVNKTLILSQNNDEDIQNAKTILLDTLYFYRTSFFVENNLNNGKIKLNIPILSQNRIIDLDIPGFVSVVKPQLKTGKNTLDLITEITEEYTFTDDDGNTQTGTKVKEITKETFVLLNDNSISNNVGNPNRILPPLVASKKVTLKSGEISTSKEIAESTLIDNSKYLFSFEIYKNSKLYNLTNANIGDTFDLYTGGVAYRTILTAILVKKATILYKFGRKRIDLVYSIKELKGGSKRW